MQTCYLSSVVQGKILVLSVLDLATYMNSWIVGINDLQFVSFKFAENTMLDADLLHIISGTM